MKTPPAFSKRFQIARYSRTHEEAIQKCSHLTTITHTAATRQLFVSLSIITKLEHRENNKADSP